MNTNTKAKDILLDVLTAILAGLVVGTAYYFFQNSNSFAPGGVGGLATITYHLLDSAVNWGILMVAFNLPIFVLVGALVNRRLGFVLILYMAVQSFVPQVYEWIGVPPYSLATAAEGDFNILFACIAAGVVSGFGFSLMLRRFGASGGTYGIAALIKRANPQINIAYVSFIMDASVVFIAFFVYGMRVTPVVCTLLNLFIADVIVDKGLSGIKNGYRFEIVTTDPEGLSQELMTKLRHGVTEMTVHGMYSHSERHLLVCIINKRQIGVMMKILKNHPETFASFTRVHEVFGNFKRRV